MSGIIPLKLADIVRDEKLLMYARDMALKIVEEDSSLRLNKNKPLADYLDKIDKFQTNWGEIS